MNFHILTQAKDQNTVNVVFHIPVPTTLNEAGIFWQQAIVEDAKGTITSVLSDISSTELTNMQNGSLIEKLESVRFSSIYLTNAQRLQEIKDRYNTLKTELITEKQITLVFMGYEGDV